MSSMFCLGVQVVAAAATPTGIALNAIAAVIAPASSARFGTDTNDLLARRQKKRARARPGEQQGLNG
jgi:hypothetical protein